MPQLVARRLAAVPTEPPIPHRRGDAGHIGTHRYLESAAAQLPVAVFGLLVTVVENVSRRIEPEQCLVGLRAVLERNDHVPRQFGHFGIEVLAPRGVTVTAAVAEICAHQTRPIHA